MRMRLLLPIALLLISSLANGEPAVNSASVEAFVNMDGSVSLSYDMEVSNPAGSPPLDRIPVSFPSSEFKIDQVRAYRCDPKAGGQVEEGGAVQVEQEGREEIALPVLRHPDPQETTDVMVDLRAHPVLAGESGSVCVNTVLQDFVARDFHCSDSAYVPIRPTLFYTKAKNPSQIFLAIHLPEGIPAKAVLAQQEWPQNQIKVALPVQEENGHAVVRWNTRGYLGEVYWIAAIFPAGRIKTRKAYDGLQTEDRIVPLEILDLDAYIQEDGKVKLDYMLQIDNSGSCKPVDAVQFVLPGRPESVSATLNDKAVNVGPYPSINNNLLPYIGQNWYQAYNASLGTSRILPQQSATIHLKTTLIDELELFDAAQGTVSLIINPTASSSGTWRPGSHWTTRIHLPAGVSESDVYSISSKFTNKETTDGRVVVTWEQSESPMPVDVSFPLGSLQNVQWSITDPSQWLFVLKRHQQFPRTIRIILTVLIPIFLLIVTRILVGVRRVLR